MNPFSAPLPHRLVAVLRIAFGWIFLYAGLTKVLDPAWTAEGYLNSAKTLTGLYGWLASADALPYVDALNSWGLTLLGVSLILGLFVRLSSSLGVVLMALYYLPIFDFPFVGKNFFLVDDHVIYILLLILLVQIRAGRFWGLDKWCSRLPLCAKFPRLRDALG